MLSRPCELLALFRSERTANLRGVLVVRVRAVDQHTAEAAAPHADELCLMSSARLSHQFDALVVHITVGRVDVEQHTRLATEDLSLDKCPKSHRSGGRTTSCSRHHTAGRGRRRPWRERRDAEAQQSQPGKFGTETADYKNTLERGRPTRPTECASRRWSAWRCSRTQTRDESAVLVSLAATQSRWRAPGSE